jgi:hypothetical protein
MTRHVPCGWFGWRWRCWHPDACSAESVARGCCLGFWAGCLDDLRWWAAWQVRLHDGKRKARKDACE